MTKTLVPGDTAPALQSQAVKCGEVVDLTLDDALKGAEYLLLVFYPADFTFVCPTEIVQFAEKWKDFEQQKCNVICCSTDSVYTHLAWLKAPKAERGLGAPDSSSIVLLSDRSHEISNAYGVLAASGAAYRGTFLIDKHKKICQVTINDMPVGRSVDDALRMLTEVREHGAQSGQGENVNTNCQQVGSVNGKPTMLQLNRQNHQSLSSQEQKQQHRKHQRQMQQQKHALPRKEVRHELGRPSGTVSVGVYLGQSRQQQQQQQQQHNSQGQLPINVSEPLSGQTEPQAEAQAAALFSGLVAEAAQLETRAAQLRLKDSEDRLARLLAESERLRVEAEKQRTDTERLKVEAQRKQTEWDRVLVSRLAGAVAADDERNWGHPGGAKNSQVFRGDQGSGTAPAASRVGVHQC